MLSPSYYEDTLIILGLKAMIVLAMVVWLQQTRYNRGNDNYFYGRKQSFVK